MYVRCPGCQTTYRLGAEKVPAGGLRLRCPGCGNVFRVREPAAVPRAPASAESPRPTPAAVPAPTPSATRVPSTPVAPVLGLERSERRPPGGPQPAPMPLPARSEAATAPPRSAPWQIERTLDLGTPAAAAAPRLETPPFTPGVAPTPQTTPAPEPGEALQGAQERARRLARALVSDILVYNQEVRDRALQEGNLASALGAEVNRAWDVYKSKVDPQVLRRTSYFKDALNEILAGGQRLF